MEIIWHNPTPQGNDLNDVVFVNDTTVIAIGDMGTLLRSHDSGLTWSLDTLMIDYDLQCMSFVDESIGYMCGAISDGGAILKTTDGGDTWTPIYYGAMFDVNAPTSIWFTDELTGYCSNLGDVHRTLDGGQTWLEVSLPTINGVRDLYFQSDSIGFCLTQDRIFRTTDAGLTWTQVLDLTDANISGYIPTLAFRDSLHGFAGIQNSSATVDQLAVTSDGGVTWSLTTLNMDVDFLEIEFYNETEGFAFVRPFGSPGSIVKTSDGGESWQTVQIGSGYNYIEEIAINNDHDVVAVGYNGELNTSSDDGALDTWIEHTNELPIGPRNATMITNEVGFLIATGAIYKTTDGGETFSETLISDFSPQDIQFPVPDTGYITAYNGFYRTIDGGDSWQNMSSLGTSERYDVFFIDRDTGYYCTQYGTSLAKTVDAANSFTSVNVDTQGLTSYLNCIYFLNSQNGFVGGRHGFFGRTSDGGQTWTLIPTGMTSVFDGIYTIYFVNDLIGFCGGSNGTLMKTTDGGLTWNYLISGQTQGISEIIFLNENEGYFTTGLGNGYTPGSIYHTYDGGLSWQLFYALNYYGIKGFDVPENFNLFVIGRGSQFWELLPSLESPEPLEPIVVCDNASFSVVVPEGYTPQWTLPGSLAIFSTDVEIPANAISGQDTLFLNYINQQNCRSAKIAVDITIIDSPEAPILAASATQVCIGDSVSITSNLNEILT
jgi:photosystem II stability/assembly factor-like uncharacterized protein